MSFSKSGCQLYFEQQFVDNNGKPFGAIAKPSRDIPKISISTPEVLQYKSLIADDIRETYYKGVISMAEAWQSISHKHFSWATVQLYYATFYLLKVSLMAKDVCLLRAGRDLFYLKTKTNEYYFKAGDNTDHKGTMVTHAHLFGNADIILGNNIDGVSAYEWLMAKREEVNYKDVKFHEPSEPDFWGVLNTEFTQKGIESTFQTLIDDFLLVGFQADYAIAAVPLQRLLQTKKELYQSGFSDVLSETQKSALTTYSIISENESLLKWLVM